MRDITGHLGLDDAVLSELRQVFARDEHAQQLENGMEVASCVDEPDGRSGIRAGIWRLC
jgi:hypothetical protein